LDDQINHGQYSYQKENEINDGVEMSDSVKKTVLAFARDRGGPFTKVGQKTARRK
jgi:hypothetical protein